MLSVRSRPRAPRSHPSPARPRPFPETPCPPLLHQRAPCTGHNKHGRGLRAPGALHGHDASGLKQHRGRIRQSTKLEAAQAAAQSTARSIAPSSRSGEVPGVSSGFGDPFSLTRMLWRLKTLWRLSGGVCRELAGDWYSMGLVSVGELAHRPSGTCGRGAARHGTERSQGEVSADRRTDRQTESVGKRLSHPTEEQRWPRQDPPHQEVCSGVQSTGLRSPVLLPKALPGTRKAPKIGAALAGGAPRSRADGGGGDLCSPRAAKPSCR